jgi:hypothetical protein
MSDALSRLSGFEATLNYVREGDQWRYTILHSEKPYRFTVSNDGRTVVIDYSNTSELKEFHMY